MAVELADGGLAGQLPPEDPRPRVLFVAFGTRGDVQPLLLLARQLQRQRGAVVTFVTHDSMRCTFGWEGGGPTFVGTPTDAHRAPTGGGEVADEYEPVVRCVESARPSLLVINLFALGPAAARACSSGVACGQTTRCSSGTTLLFSHEARARGAALASRHAGTHALRSSA